MISQSRGRVALYSVAVLFGITLAYFLKPKKLLFPNTPVNRVFCSQEQDKPTGLSKINVDRIGVVVFSPTDCDLCLAMLRKLNQIYEQHRFTVPFIGIVDTPYRQAALKMCYIYGLHFPVFRDSLGVIKKTIYPVAKPILIYVRDGVVEKRAIIGLPEHRDKVHDIISQLTAPGGNND